MFVVSQPSPWGWWGMAHVSVAWPGLHDSDEQVNQMAEHGLWSIWFRSCEPAAAHAFHEGISQIAQEDYEKAIDCFREAIHIDPAFAEAYNQCGIARFFLGQWRDSIEDSQQALLRQPCHFGAMAGMGHCYTHLGELRNALDCYRRVVAINPRMTAIASAIEHLEQQLTPSTSPAEAGSLGSINTGFRMN